MTKTNPQKVLKSLLFISLFLNLSAGIYLARRFYLKQQITLYVPPPKPAYYLDRNKLFEVLPKDSNSIIFLGNSLTQYFELAELFKNNHIKNRGIHGDDIEGALKRITPVVQSQPQKIFIELGGNDLDLGHTKIRLLNNYKRLLDTLQAACPKAKIYVQSLLPNENSSRLMPSYCSPQRNKEIKEVNVDLRKLAEEKGCTYIDAYSRFVLNGQLNPNYSVDGVHLSGEGYLVWTKILEPYVEE
jgi:lysophospholipase L1-like esterase